MPPSTHTQAEWDKYAEEIEELLKVKTFKEVAAYMEAEHNFSATTKQYKDRFKGKKNVTTEEWKWINLEIQSRAAAGKQSHVYFNETLLPADRVNRATGRCPKRAHSEIESNGMPNPPQKRISVRTPPASTPEPNSDQRDILGGGEEDIGALEISVLPSTTEQSSEVPFIPDTDLGLEASLQFNFEMSISPGPQPPMLALSEFEGSIPIYPSFDSPRTGNDNFASMPPTSPREMRQGGMSSSTSDTPDLSLMGRDGSPFSVSNFVIHSGVEQWMANLPIFQVQYFLEQLAHMSPQAHSVRECSPLASTVPFNGLSMEAGQRVLANLLGPATGKQLQENFPQILSRLQNLVPEKEPNALSKQLGYLLDSRSISSSGVWFLFGLGAYFSSNNLLDQSRTYTFLKWVIDQHCTEQLELFLDIKAPTIRIFSVKILKSAIRIKNFKFATALLRRGVMLDKPMDEVAWIDDTELAKQILDRAGPEFYNGGSGSQLLRHVLQENRLDLARKIVDNGVSVDAVLGGATLLYIAAQEGEVRNVRFLLERGADVNSISHMYYRDRISKTALAVAVVEKRSEIVAMLLEHDASISCKVGDMDLLEWTSLEDRSMYNLLRKRVGDVGFNLGDLVFAAEEGTQSLEAYKSSHRERITTHQLERALHESIERAHSAAVLALLQSGVSPDGDTLRKRPLETAIGSKKPFEICQLLINLGATVDVPGILRTVVASRDSGRLLPLFVESEVNLHHQCFGALVEAAKRGDMRSAVYLLARGVDVNTLDLGWTPLQAAASGAELEMVELLLSHNANIDAPAYPNDGRTALQAALEEEGGLEVAELFLERGADVSAPPALVKGMTALEAACRWWWYGEEEERRAICNRLLDAGAPVNRPGGKASWALHRVIQNGEDDILARFLEPHRNIVLEHMWAEPEAEWHDEEPQPRTPIQLAAECGRITQVKMLFHRGADINADPAPRFGRTALQAAASTGNKELVEFLLANRAVVNAKPAPHGGITALQGAAISGNVMLVALLLEKDALVNAKPSFLEGRYAIEGAAEHGRLDTVQFLLNAGATGGKGLKFAIELAKENGHSEVVALLEETEKNRLHSGTNKE